MIDLTKMYIEPEAVDQLPTDWLEQLNRGMGMDYLFGYDSMLDEAYVWFDANRENAVHIPLTSIIDVVIDDETDQVIGLVARRFAQIVLALDPTLGKVMVRDANSKELRLPGDIAMTPIQHVTSVVPNDEFRRALSQATHLLAA